MKLRTRIFLVFVLVMTTGFGSLTWWIAGDLRPRYLEAMEEPLVDMAQVLAELLVQDVADTHYTALSETFARIYARRFKAQVYGLQRESVDVLVYVTDRNGIVVFDSAGERVGQDFSRWNDVYKTLRGEYGARSTPPGAAEHAVAYVAAPILRGEEIIGVVSVGKPKRNVDRFFLEARRKFVIGGVVAAVVVLVLSLVLYLWVSRPLQRLTGYVQALRRGERVNLPDLGRNEIGEAGQAIAALRRELDGKDYIERYTQTLTHEIKSPLAAIRGAAEILKENPPAEDRLRFLENIRSETDRLNTLIARLLQLAALESRSALESCEKVSVPALLKEAVAGIEMAGGARDIVVESENLGSCTVNGDPVLLRQAIDNLLQNAIEFSFSGGVVQVSLQVVDGSVRLRVRDHGAGIPDYATQRIFERFYSLPRPQGHKSSGLGLSFVREVAKLHHGGVTVANHAGGGVLAELSLPLA